MGGWPFVPKCLHLSEENARVSFDVRFCDGPFFDFCVFAKRGGVRKFCIINGKGLGKGTKVGDFGFF